MSDGISVGDGTFGLKTLFAQVNDGPGEAALHPVVPVLARLGGSLGDSSDRVRESLNGVGVQWRGQAAGNTTSAMQQLVSWADRGGHAGGAASSQVDAYSRSFSTFKAAVRPAEPVLPPSLWRGLLGVLSDRSRALQRNQEYADQAFRALGEHQARTDDALGAIRDIEQVPRPTDPAASPRAPHPPARYPTEAGAALPHRSSAEPPAVPHRGSAEPPAGPHGGSAEPPDAQRRGSAEPPTAGVHPGSCEPRGGSAEPHSAPTNPARLPANGSAEPHYLGPDTTTPSGYPPPSTTPPRAGTPIPPNSTGTGTPDRPDVPFSLPPIAPQSDPKALGAGPNPGPVPGPRGHLGPPAEPTPALTQSTGARTTGSTGMPLAGLPAGLGGERREHRGTVFLPSDEPFLVDLGDQVVEPVIGQPRTP
jgi:hypothetical protein